MKFRGYQLIKLNKATGNEDPSTTCEYDVTIHNVFGVPKTITMKLNEIERDFGGLRMGGDRFAKLVSGQLQILTEEEYNSIVESLK